MTAVEHQDVEGLAIAPSKARLIVTLDVEGAAKGLAPLDRLRDPAPAELDRRAQTRGLRRTEPGHRLEGDRG
jgi:hypothetical protein